MTLHDDFCPWLINESPQQYIKSVAVAIGFNEAVAIQQLNYWLNLNRKAKKLDHFREGHWWAYNTYDGWQKTDFPFWSVPTIKRVFASLEKLGLVASEQFDKQKGNCTKWYTICYRDLNRLMAQQYGEPTGDGAPPSDQSDPRGTDPELHSIHPSDHSDPRGADPEIKLIRPSDQCDPTLGSNRSDPQIKMIRSYTETNSRDYLSEISNRDKETRVGCAADRFSQPHSDRPEFEIHPARSTVDLEAIPLLSDTDLNSGEDQCSAPAKKSRKKKINTIEAKVAKKVTRISDEAIAIDARLTAEFDAEQFERFWVWYRDHVCKPHEAKVGSKVNAKAAWMAMFAMDGFTFELFRGGCRAWKTHLKGRAGIPHFENFLIGSEIHAGPYWMDYLGDRPGIDESDLLGGGTTEITEEKAARWAAIRQQHEAAIAARHRSPVCHSGCRP